MTLIIRKMGYFDAINKTIISRCYNEEHDNMFGDILPVYRSSCNVSYVADRCTTLPYFDHAVLGEGVNGLVSSSARFLCRPGYRFPDGSTLKSISCQKNLEWELIDDCIGENSFYFYRSYVQHVN